MYWSRTQSLLSLGVAVVALECGGSDSTAPSTGSVQVTASTTGADLDPDGYTVAVDGGAGQPLAVNGTVSFSPLSAGNHTVALSGLAANCTPSGQNPRTVGVSAGSSVQTVFQIACVAITGTLEVTASTAGADPDPDGYVVAVDGGAGQSLAVNGSITFSQMRAGGHSVALSGIATNCTVSGQNPTTVTVSVGATAQIAFQVTCARIDLIAFARLWDGNFDIYVMQTDGTARVNLTNNGANDVGPAWSPDGTKIAFTSDRNASLYTDSEIYVMNADGSSVTRLTQTPVINWRVSSSGPSWSPDGAKIAFASNRDGADAIYVMNADGSSVSRLTNNLAAVASDEAPAWSPDGSRIAFLRVVYDLGPNFDVYVMNTDGTNQINLTNSAGVDDQCGGLSWSHDGSKIGFGSDSLGNGDTCRHRDIYLMNPDGTGVQRLTNTGYDSSPSWSPDGAKIAFASYRDGSWNIYVMNADGTAPVKLTNDLTANENPAWRP